MAYIGDITHLLTIYIHLLTSWDIQVGDLRSPLLWTTETNWDDLPSNCQI